LCASMKGEVIRRCFAQNSLLFYEISVGVPVTMEKAKAEATARPSGRRTTLRVHIVARPVP